MKPIFYASALLLLLSFSTPSYAHNGAVAIALPVEGIAVDGDLSDWPEGLKRYSIGLVGPSDAPGNEEDYRGFFRIGYNVAENALYLAVEMQDESRVVADGGAWDAKDGCEVYVDAVHVEKERPVGQYAMRGNAVGVNGENIDSRQMQVAVQRTAGSHQYEWRIDIEEKTGGTVRLRPGMSLGVDVVLDDRDEDGSFSWMSWGPEEFKFTSMRLGDVVLVAAEGTGTLRGRLTREGSDVGVHNEKVQVQALRSPALWVVVAADRTGSFAADLPSGEYRVQLVWPNRGERQVFVQKGRSTAFDLIVQALQGERVPVGRGTGHWQTFNVADGLVSNTVYAIHQDREGTLWFGTENGVGRYDGRAFTSFTKRDGLADNWVTAILEDRSGDLWFGTGYGGISRYDGRQDVGERFVTFTIEDGLADSWVNAIVEDRSGDLWIGTWNGGVSRYDGRQDVGERFVTFTTEEGLAHNRVFAIHQDQEGILWFGTQNGLSRYDGEHFVTFTTEEGLVSNTVYAIHQDRSGDLWFGTGNGLSRYDGERFVTFTTEKGLPYPQVQALMEDREGNLWLGTRAGNDVREGALIRYDGKEFVAFTTEDGLAYNVVFSMMEDAEGSLWFGTGMLGLGGGVSRYSSDQFTTFTTRDGLAHDYAWNIVEDRQGDLWILTGESQAQTITRYDGDAFVHYEAPSWAATQRLLGGVLEDRRGDLWFGRIRYDGRFFTSFSGADKLPSSGEVGAIVEDRVGHLWFALWIGGVVRYDGEAFAPFTLIDSLKQLMTRCLLWDRHSRLWIGTWFGGLFRWDGEGREPLHFSSQNGLGDDGIGCLFEDRDGRLWIGTWNGGVSWYDPSATGGEIFHTLTQKDGLAGNWVNSIAQDRRGHLFFSTHGGGVSLYDGLVLQNLTTRDGLAGNMVFDVLPDSQGNIWFCTTEGLTRYRPVSTSPPVRITEVTVDRRLGPVDDVQLNTTQDHLAFTFQGRSLMTRLEQLAYVYRLEGYDDAWRTTREEQVIYPDLPTGEYRFQVKAVDRDLNYSEEPAEVRVTVHPPYAQLGLIGGLGIALVGFILASGYGIKRRRDLHRAEQALMQEMEEELQTAHDMQMGLMPLEAPHISGFDIAGRCLPANHVGGDFFQFFRLSDERFAICMADVTGHAMEAAVPVMMFSGVLKTEMRHGVPLAPLFSQLNSTMHESLDTRTYVCFCMGELDIADHHFRLANAACPYPFHFHAATGAVEEIQVDAYPLGVREGTVYTAIETVLESGDQIVFCSDGIAEAANEQEEMFGFEQTTEAIRQACAEGLEPEALIDRLLGAVKEFAGDVPQGDDMTVVVLKVGT
jgi:ligand-binding sensor domain-containing protein/serine phosphatase RsbU (regulator of sigma subunit)